MSIITDIGKSVRSHIVGGRLTPTANQTKSQVDASEVLSPAPETRKGRSRSAAGPKNPLTLPKPTESGAVGRMPKDAETIQSGMPEKTSKHEGVLRLLRRQDGATIDELMAATTWQAHSVRGFLSGTVRKKLGLNLISEVAGDGFRRYRIVADDKVGVPAHAVLLVRGSPSSEQTPNETASERAI